MFHLAKLRMFSNTLRTIELLERALEIFVLRLKKRFFCGIAVWERPSRNSGRDLTFGISELIF